MLLHEPPVDWCLTLIREMGERRALRFAARPTMHEGFHAFRNYEGAESQGYGVPVRNRTKWEACYRYPVLGHVSLYGRVVEYERGYRAERMRIDRLELYEADDPVKAKKALEQTYQCDVEEQWQTSEERSESMRSSPSGLRHLSARTWTVTGTLNPPAGFDPAVSEKPSLLERLKRWGRREWWDCPWMGGLVGLVAGLVVIAVGEGLRAWAAWQ